MELITICLIAVILVQQLIFTYERRQKDKEFKELAENQSRLIKAETLQDFVIMSPQTVPEPTDEEENSDLIDPEYLTPDLLTEER